MIRFETIARKPIIYLNAKEAAVLNNEMARRSNVIALDLLASGIRGEVTAKDIKKAAKPFSLLNSKGYMKKEGRQSFIQGIRYLFDMSEKQAKKLTTQEYMDRILSGISKEEAGLHARKLGYNI